MFITVLSLIVSVIFAFVFRQASSCVDLFRTNYQRVPFDVIEVIKLFFIMQIYFHVLVTCAGV